MLNREQQREKWAHQKSRSWRVFREVMDYYYECIANMAACQPVDYDGNAGSHGYVIGKVIMLPADFISDVALMSKKVLDDGQFGYFKTKYLNQTEHKQTTINSTDVKIQELLGSYFFKVGLYPVHKYMKTIRKF